MKKKTFAVWRHIPRGKWRQRSRWICMRSEVNVGSLCDVKGHAEYAWGQVNVGHCVTSEVTLNMHEVRVLNMPEVETRWTYSRRDWGVSWRNWRNSQRNWRNVRAIGAIRDAIDTFCDAIDAICAQLTQFATRLTHFVTQLTQNNAFHGVIDAFWWRIRWSRGK